MRRSRASHGNEPLSKTKVAKETEMKNITVLGTPKSIEECVVRIVCMRPPEGTMIDQYARHVFRDFLSQKFGVAMLKAETDHETKLIMELWSTITGERKL